MTIDEEVDMEIEQMQRSIWTRRISWVIIIFFMTFWIWIDLRSVPVVVGWIIVATAAGIEHSESKSRLRILRGMQRTIIKNVENVDKLVRAQNVTTDWIERNAWKFEEGRDPDASEKYGNIDGL